MSNPVTNVEIEDVLSSIRRLVSDDSRAKRPVQAAAQPDRLVLTPALRVKQDDRDETAQVPEPESAAQGPVLLVNPSLPEETAVPDEQAQPDAASMPDRAETTDPDPDPDPEPESVAGLFDADAVSLTASAILGQLVDREVDSAFAQDVADAMSDEGPEEPLEALEDLALPDGSSLDALLLEMPQDMPAEPDWGDMDSVGVPEAAEVVDRAQDSHDSEPDSAEASLESKIAALEAMVGQQSGDLESESASDAPFVHRPPSPLEWEDLKSEAEVAAAPQGQPSAALIDEGEMRRIVSEIVRQELQGALGERITRNVRKLVRREIHRVMLSQDFD